MTKYGIGILLMLLLCGCSSQKYIIDEKELSEKKALDGKTGFVTIVSTESEPFDQIEACKTTLGLMTLTKDGSNYDIHFSPNKVLAATIPPGIYNISCIEYVCEGYPKEKSKRGFRSCQQDQGKIRLMIPNDGFCKIDVLAENNELVLTPGNEKLAAMSNRENLPVNFSGMDDCQLYMLDSFYKTNARQQAGKGMLTSDDFVWKSFGNAVKIALKGNMGLNAVIDRNASDIANVVAEMRSKKDFSQCSVLKYDYHGSQHTFFATASLLGGTFVSHPFLLGDAADWQTVVIPIKDVKPLYKDVKNTDFFKAIIGFTWKVNGYSSVGNFVEIENLRCE